MYTRIRLSALHEVWVHLVDAITLSERKTAAFKATGKMRQPTYIIQTFKRVMLIRKTEGEKDTGWVHESYSKG